MADSKILSTYSFSTFPEIFETSDDQIFKTEKDINKRQKAFTSVLMHFNARQFKKINKNFVLYALQGAGGI